MNTWIDFKALRAKLDFEQVLRQYGVEVKRKGKQHHGFCPLPNHNGKRNSPSFSANLERGIFQCFGCGAKGNVLEFVALMENVDPKQGVALRAVAVKLQQRYCPELGSETPANSSPPAGKTKQAKTEPELPVVVNAPLDFELKGLNRNHPYLLGRGFTPMTIEHFGLGFCSRGMLKDRIAIPLMDAAGKLVGYAGRVVDDSMIAEDNPRYRFPGARTKDGKLFEFQKTLFVYNGFRFKGPIDDLVVVESFTSVWWLTQNGFSDVVATMGADCSEKQAEIIISLVRPDGRIWVLSDGDPAGDRHALSVLTRVSQQRFTRWVKLGEGRQPTNLTGDEIKACLKT
jgi:DNA primase